MGSPIPAALLALAGGLEGFVEAIPKRRPRCVACLLREEHPTRWAEVIAGRARPIPRSFRVIAEYLVTLGSEVTWSQLRNHFLNHEAR